MADLPPFPSCLAQRSIRIETLDAEPGRALLCAYTWMYLGRRADERILELFRQGRIRGTVTGGQGNEGLAAPLALLLDREQDVISFTHRDLCGHLVWSGTLVELLCQYLANAGSPTRAREGNIHHGDPSRRSLPMISHLGAMVSNVIGATDAQRRSGVAAVGVAQFGDGGSSTGDIHESMNLATVLPAPVLFIVQNNEYAYSTPASEQYASASIAIRAASYGMEGEVVDASDTEGLLRTLARSIGEVRRSGRPRLLEVRTLRLRGHAAYDTCEYLTREQQEAWVARDPLPRLRRRLCEELGFAQEVSALETELNAYFEACLGAAMTFPPPHPEGMEAGLFAPTAAAAAWSPRIDVRSSAAEEAGGTEPLTVAQALNRGLRKILAERAESIVMGQDIAEYGGAFRVTEGLRSEFGRARVLNTPLAESATVGYATGLALLGRRPIVEFQFSDFSTEAFTQITQNAATYHFRAGAKVPLVLRYPCGGGLTFGSFHSQELEAAFLHLPGLKALYPSTPQDAFDALLAAWEDDNPVLLFEHKKLYRGLKARLSWNPDYRRVWEPRLVRPGSLATLVTYGEMVLVANEAADYLSSEYGMEVEVWDLRALSPLRLDPIRASLARTHRLAVLHEGRRNLGFGAELVARLVEEQFDGLEAPPLRLGSLDLPVPFAPELEAVYRPSRDSVADALIRWLS